MHSHRSFYNFANGACDCFFEADMACLSNVPQGLHQGLLFVLLAIERQATIVKVCTICTNNGVAF